MPCGCQHTTYVCVCRHKERVVRRCWTYVFKKEHSCLGSFFANCHPQRRKKRISRVCELCDKFFHERYGSKYAKFVAGKFIAYKESKGCAKMVVDPASVPRETYLSAEDLVMVEATSSQPFRPKSPMEYSRPNSFDIAAQGALPHDYYVEDAVIDTATGQVIDLSDLIDEEPDLNNDIQGESPELSLPKHSIRKSHCEIPIGQFVPPELQHLNNNEQLVRSPVGARGLQQPQPLRPKTNPRGLRLDLSKLDTHSNSSLVKRLTAAADQMTERTSSPPVEQERPNINGVPILDPAPRGRREQWTATSWPNKGRNSSNPVPPPRHTAPST
ncbi:hypothetical protein F5Y15DRAFT_227797 [Xylariaceae sp. FL0016]|nr:hypothetical protein F5Y15DRAFT_227797 [Xylariaceae sp. FL0016]